MGGISRVSLKQVTNKDTKNYLGKNGREGLITKWGSEDNCPPSVHKIFWVLPPEQKNPDRSSFARRDLGTVECKRKDSSNIIIL